MTTTSDAHGPIDFVLLEFPNDRTDGSAAEALLELVEAGTIRLLDLVIARKEADGTVEVIDIDGAGDVTRLRAVLRGPLRPARRRRHPGGGRRPVPRDDRGTDRVREQPGRHRSSPRPARTAARSIASMRIPASDVIDALDALETEEAR